MGSLNPSKNNDIPSLDLKACFVVLSSDRLRVPQDAKVNPPSMPNERFPHEKWQDPLATMLESAILEQ